MKVLQKAALIRAACLGKRKPAMYNFAAAGVSTGYKEDAG